MQEKYLLVSDIERRYCRIWDCIPEYESRIKPFLLRECFAAVSNGIPELGCDILHMPLLWNLTQDKASTEMLHRGRMLLVEVWFWLEKIEKNKCCCFLQSWDQRHCCLVMNRQRVLSRVNALHHRSRGAKKSLQVGSQEVPGSCSRVKRVRVSCWSLV